MPISVGRDDRVRGALDQAGQRTLRLLKFGVGVERRSLRFFALRDIRPRSDEF